MRIAQADLISIANVGTNLGANLTGLPLSLNSMWGFAFQISWTGGGGTLAGTFKIQASLDKIDNPNPQWSTITGTETVIAAGVSPSGDTSLLWNISPVILEQCRLVFIRTGGTGVLTAAKFDAKGY